MHSVVQWRANPAAPMPERNLRKIAPEPSIYTGD
jgi:hypothetical protein